MLLRLKNTTPQVKKHSLKRRSVVFWSLMILILYFLSGGPLAMFLERGRLSNSNRLYEIYITPLAWTYEKTLFHKPLGWYFHLWAPKSFDTNGDEKA